MIRCRSKCAAGNAPAPGVLSGVGVEKQGVGHNVIAGWKPASSFVRKFFRIAVKPAGDSPGCDAVEV
jgi:hypothetical protein